ncbi:MAG: hypothetical protein MUC50_05925 [Myxococcota bacterium]|jgi:hypothetical protein|nr:hypothetical protein [Myxococcota bacterium]
MRLASHFAATLLGVSLLFNMTASAQEIGTGEGVDAEILWLSPGPSNFATVSSSDIASHKDVAFSGILGYKYRPIGLATPGKDSWVVRHALSANFLWAFGLMDWIQLGLDLPIVIFQNGDGAQKVRPAGTPVADYALASSALGDLKLHVKARFLGGFAELPDRRGLGLALDLGLAVPTGDELAFAGDAGAVLFPSLIVDYHLCKFSAAINVGGRLRFSHSDPLADTSVGHQGTAGIAVTGHYLDRRFLITGEAIALAELDGFERLGVELRGGLGYVPDGPKAVTIWLTGGTSVGTGDVLGMPAIRALLSLSYSPRRSPEDEPAQDDEEEPLTMEELAPPT